MALYSPCRVESQDPDLHFPGRQRGANCSESPSTWYLVYSHTHHPGLGTTPHKTDLPCVTGRT